MRTTNLQQRMRRQRAYRDISCNRLHQQGHEVVAASSKSGVNTLIGEGLPEAPLALAQPIGSDDVAAARVDVAVGPPVNGAIEIAGPERIPLDKLVRRFLTATHDPRKVVTDAHARYFGIGVNDQSLTPGSNARIGPTRFENWLSSMPRK